MQRRKVETNGVDELVDTVLVPNELGVRKPNPAIFNMARERLPADCGFLTVYVGKDARPAATVSAAAAGDLATFLRALLDGAAPDASA